MAPRQEGIPTLFLSGLFQVFTLILLFVALLYGQQGLVLLAVLILIMFNGARFWCRISMGALHSSLNLDKKRVFPGESLVLEAKVSNNKFLPVWLQITVLVDRLLLEPAARTPVDFPRDASVSSETGCPASDLSSAETETHSFASSGNDCPVSFIKDIVSGEGGLLWQQEASWRWNLTAQHRGIYAAGPLRLATGDLFGFYHKEKKISDVQSVIVYPRLVQLNSLAVPLRELFGVPGVKSPVVDPVYPVATQDYQEGQPARNINWKASVRHGRLQENVFQASGQQKILIAVDVEQFHREKAGETFERTLEVVASMAVQLEQQGRVFGLVSNGVLKGEKDLPAYLPPRRGLGQAPYLLEMLARLQMHPANNMGKNLLHGAGYFRGVTCLYFTYNSIKIHSSTEELLKRFHIPVTFILGKAPVSLYDHFYCLDKLLGEEMVDP